MLFAKIDGWSVDFRSRAPLALEALKLDFELLAMKNDQNG